MLGEGCAIRVKLKDACDFTTYCLHSQVGGRDGPGGKGLSGSLKLQAASVSPPLHLSRPSRQLHLLVRDSLGPIWNSMIQSCNSTASPKGISVIAKLPAAGRIRAMAAVRAARSLRVSWAPLKSCSSCQFRTWALHFRSVTSCHCDCSCKALLL
ncbi:hypothetical protein AAFF_G00201130 [Aldrovandia affinis]|uniref:Uncharacterized protein n=1 Tax=Aldrovandia affinis TaxID=143900 RepID=A0AAD7VX97_9TELE|nr:hypothetical protein AAFF_G00201130 [Aldrovandia affinis]